MANAPLPERDGESSRFDLGQKRNGIFLQAKLDRAKQVESIAENRVFAHDNCGPSGGHGANRWLIRGPAQNHENKAEPSLLSRSGCEMITLLIRG
jgi:hypothetical protein